MLCKSGFLGCFVFFCVVFVFIGLVIESVQFLTEEITHFMNWACLEAAQVMN